MTSFTIGGTWGALSERARRFLSRRQAFRDCFMDNQGQLTASGARVLRLFAKKAGAYRSSVRLSPVSGVVDSHAMAVAEGRREMYLYLQSMLELPDKAVLDAMEEPQE